jgi:hypothetical protein
MIDLLFRLSLIDIHGLHKQLSTSALMSSDQSSDKTFIFCDGSIFPAVATKTSHSLGLNLDSALYLSSKRVKIL